jgi:hypothetical protein
MAKGMAMRRAPEVTVDAKNSPVSIGSGGVGGRNVPPPSVETMTPSAVTAHSQGFPLVPLAAAMAKTCVSILPFRVQVAPASAE